MRKTISLQNLIHEANETLSQSPDDSKQHREAIQSFVSKILMDAKVYAGFGYIRPYEEKANDPNYDETRIFFYVHNSIRTWG